MRAEAVISTLLKAAAGVTALVGTRISLTRMVENAPMPALVYAVVSGVPVPPINAAAGSQIMRTRVQITAMGKTVGDVKNILEQTRLALDFQSGLIAGVRVISITRELIGMDFKNDETSVYGQSTDYMVLHYET